MKKVLLHILLVLLAVKGVGQPLPSWRVQVTDFVYRHVVFSNALKINGKQQNLRPNDHVAVFIKHPDLVYRCAGYGIYTAASDTLTIMVHLRDTLKNPEYKLYYWNDALKCQVELTDSTKADFLSYYSFTTSASGTIPSIGYPADTLYRNQGIATISRPFPDMSFKAKYAGLVLNDSSGTINLSLSSPGTYIIDIETDYCLADTQKTITIAERTVDTATLDLSRLAYDILQPTCQQEGTISIRQNSISGNAPYTFLLTNVADNTQTYGTSGIFTDVREGKYLLTISDSSGNNKSLPGPLTILKTENCRNTVLRPDGHDGIQSLYIPEAGKAKILDRFGELIKEITVPGEWNCDDLSGKQVPMGDYYLYINDQQQKVITVLR